jgi:hypothetical protein
VTQCRFGRKIARARRCLTCGNAVRHRLLLSGSLRLGPARGGWLRQIRAKLSLAVPRRYVAVEPCRAGLGAVALLALASPVRHRDPHLSGRLPEGGAVTRTSSRLGSGAAAMTRCGLTNAPRALIAACECVLDGELGTETQNRLPQARGSSRSGWFDHRLVCAHGRPGTRPVAA